MLLGLLVLGVVIAIALPLRRLYFGTGEYDNVPPQLPLELHDPAILVFSKTNGFRHKEAIPAANAAIDSIAKAQKWSVFFTENGAVFNPRDLSRFSATVWNNTSGDVLTVQQREAFRAYIENGRGFVGLHGAGGDPRYQWRWYVETLIGAQFKGHPIWPRLQTATINIENQNDPATKALGDVWARTDEWYSFRKSPRSGGVKVLATIDERTYRPRMLWKDISMGADHPVIWKHPVGRGRAYSALGHSPSAYEERLYIKVLRGAIAWAAGLEADDGPE